MKKSINPNTGFVSGKGVTGKAKNNPTSGFVSGQTVKDSPVKDKGRTPINPNTGFVSSPTSNPTNVRPSLPLPEDA